MNMFQHPLVLNSFYHPNYAFLFLLFSFVLQAAIIVVPIWIIVKYRQALLSWISKDYTFSVLLALLAVVFSRVVVMFFNSSHIQMLPEQTFVMDMVGRDWLDGVMRPIMSLWEGIAFDPKIGYGQGLSVFLGILLYPLYKTGACSPDSVLTCSHTGYLILSLTVLAGYVTVIFRFFKSSVRTLLLIGFITFILGYAGSLGLERGNTDTIFSLIILLLYLFRTQKTIRSQFSVWVEGCILGLLCSSKITLLPVAFVFIITSPRLLLSGLQFVFWYAFWSLIPFAFGIQSTLLDSYIAGSTFQKIFFSDPLKISCWAGNHVLLGLASFFIPCFAVKLNIYNTLFSVVEYIVFTVLCGVVFVLPVVPLITGVKTAYTTIIASIRYLYTKRSDFLLLFLVLAVAAMNLLPVFSFAYRLYFSFAVLLAAWHTITTEQAKRLLVLSTLCLLLKGLWLTDLRILNLLIALHYMSLISAASTDVLSNLHLRRSRREKS